MPRSFVRSVLRKVTDVGTAAAATIEIAVAQGLNPIADGATDTVANTIAGRAFTRAYSVISGGTTLLTVGQVTFGNQVNCTITLGGSTLVGLPAIAQDGTTTGISETIVPFEPNLPPAATSTLTVTVTPTAAGAWSCSVGFPNNDANENPFNWNIDGVAVADAPEMNVLEGANPLADGGTDAVGNLAIALPTARTYTINNAGGAALGITVPVIRGSLVNCAVAVTTQPTATIAAFGTAPFVIEITPAAAGAFSFTLSMANTDANENPYNWTVSGTAVAAEIAVLEGANPLADGGTDAVGDLPSGAGAPRTYTINNTGVTPLGITVPVVIGAEANCSVVVDTQPAASVAGSGTTTLALTITPTAPGAFSFTVSFANTDADENPYNWTVSGTAT
jgi:hypothetical protein